MEFKEALKVIQNKKVKDNFLLIETYYDKKLILPYKDGMIFLSSLATAEQFRDSYGKPTIIGELERDFFKVTTISAIEYEQIKIAALLNVSIDDVREHYKEAA